MNKNIPVVSVVMSVYRGGIYLRESIDSILNQTFNNFEFIIVNDGADKVTGEILEEFKNKDGRIRVIFNKKNLGLAESLNKAISTSKGRYIARMDDDDISRPKRLEEQVEYLDVNTNIFLVGTGMEKIDEEGKSLGKYLPPSSNENIYQALEKYNPIIHPSIMFRRENMILYRNKFKAVQDYDLYLRIKDLGLKMANINKVLLKYRISQKHSDISRMLKHSSYKYLALDYHRERITMGRDSYTEFDPQTFENLTIENLQDSRVLEDIILSFFKGRKYEECRRYCKKFFSKFGIKPTIIYFYLRSILV